MLQTKVMTGTLRRNALRLSVFLGAFSYLYLILFVPIGTPILLGFDDKLFLYEASEILRGQVAYRDLFDFNFPGTEFFYVSLIWLLGPRAWIPNLSLLGLGIGFLGASVVIARRLFTGSTVFLPGLLFLCLSFHNNLDATHHWFSSLLIIIAVAILMESRSAARLSFAGGLTGLATCFSLNHGVAAAAGFVTFAWWEAVEEGRSTRLILRSQLHLMGPFALIVGGCIAYFTWRVGFGTFVYSTVVFPIKYWSIAFAGTNTFSDYLPIEVAKALLHYHFRGILRRLVLAILIPGIYLLAIGCYRLCATPASSRQWRLVLLITTVGLSLFVAILNSATFFRLSAVSLPGFIILIWLIDRKAWSRVAIRLLWTVVVLIMLRDILVSQETWATYVDLPSGRVAPYDPELQWLAQNTHPGEYVFDSNWEIYFLLELRNPTKLMIVTPDDFTRPEQVQAAVVDLEKHHVPLIIWGNDLDTAKRLSSTDHIQPLRDYLQQHYKRIRDFADSSIWERMPNSH